MITPPATNGARMLDRGVDGARGTPGIRTAHGPDNRHSRTGPIRSPAPHPPNVSNVCGVSVTPALVPAHVVHRVLECAPPGAPPTAMTLCPSLRIERQQASKAHALWGNSDTSPYDPSGAIRSSRGLTRPEGVEPPTRRWVPEEARATGSIPAEGSPWTRSAFARPRLVQNRHSRPGAVSTSTPPPPRPAGSRSPSPAPGAGRITWPSRWRQLWVRRPASCARAFHMRRVCLRFEAVCHSTSRRKGRTFPLRMG